MDLRDQMPRNVSVKCSLFFDDRVTGVDHQGPLYDLSGGCMLARKGPADQGHGFGDYVIKAQSLQAAKEIICFIIKAFPNAMNFNIRDMDAGKDIANYSNDFRDKADELLSRNSALTPEHLDLYDASRLNEMEHQRRMQLIGLSEQPNGPRLIAE